MSKVTVNLSMSLDGFIAGPNVSVRNPMGDGGDRLHDWMFSDKTDREIEEFEVKSFKNTGAVVIGRRTFDAGVGPWGDNPPFHVPCFIVSSRPLAKITKEGGTSYTIVTVGLEGALAQARAASGEKDVMVLGGANVIQQCLKAGLLDEIEIHLIPVLFGEGVRLFENLNDTHIELERISVKESPGVTHLGFRVVKQL